jgi:hypothetical protein
MAMMIQDAPWAALAASTFFLACLAATWGTL